MERIGEWAPVGVPAGYKQFLEAEQSITEIGEATSGREALGELRRTNWDLLLMDIHMPDRSGLRHPVRRMHKVLPHRGNSLARRDRSSAADRPEASRNSAKNGPKRPNMRARKGLAWQPQSKSATFSRESFRKTNA